MVVFRPDPDAQSDGLEDEVFNIIYTKLPRAKEECAKYLELVWKDEPGVIDYGIDWFEDSSSTKERPVHFGRPRALLDGNFYLYSMKIEI